MLKTMANLAKAFIGESQARNRYVMYAKEAKKEGFIQISEIFLETARNEEEHAKWFFRMLQMVKEEEKEVPEEIIVDSVSPLDIGDTKSNLLAAIKGEHEESSGLYPEFAKDAGDEGFPDIAARIRAITKSEMHHEERYSALLEEVENGTVFKKKDKRQWVCQECGYMHEGEEPPEKCPSCDHPKGYFKIKCERY